LRKILQDLARFTGKNLARQFAKILQDLARFGSSFDQDLLIFNFN
jgi:hypothetical protein